MSRKATSFAMITVVGLSSPLGPNVTCNLNILYNSRELHVTASCITYSNCWVQSCSWEEIGLRNDHSKTGSFSVFSKFCPLKHKIYIVYQYFYFTWLKSLLVFCYCDTQATCHLLYYPYGLVTFFETAVKKSQS